MANQNNFQLPAFIIKETKPLLKKDEMVFAYEVTLTTKNGELFKVYENKGFDLSNYINEKVECLLEITRGHFRYKNKKGNKPENVASFQYRWLKRPYEFFPELVKMRENLNSNDTSYRNFDTTAEKFFKEWGLNGLNIGVYQAKPLLKSLMGIFLLNEYEFEEELDRLELNEEIYIEIEELYLRGIRPCTPLKSLQPTPPKPKEEPPPPIQKEEVSDKKKGRFDSLLNWKEQDK